MPATAKLMTNILPQYYVFLEEESERAKKTKREIIEEALALYKREEKKKEIINAYKKMADDKEYLEEMHEMAEMGMEYFLTDIDNANK
jgi:CRISPR/Cas system-associated protein Csm6